jgi:queuine tRNA-ribosyltransferase
MKGLRDAIAQGTLEQFVDSFYKRIGKEKPALDN